MKSLSIDDAEYVIDETHDYLQFEKLFKAAGLEFNLDGSNLRPQGFIKAFRCSDEKGKTVGGSSIAHRKGYFILNDIAVDGSLRGKGMGKCLLEITESEIKKLGGESIYITAKAPGFFEKYGFVYLKDIDVPDIFTCPQCAQFKNTCDPRFMKKCLFSCRYDNSPRPTGLHNDAEEA